MLRFAHSIRFGSERDGALNSNRNCRKTACETSEIDGLFSLLGSPAVVKIGACTLELVFHRVAALKCGRFKRKNLLLPGELQVSIHVVVGTFELANTD